MIRFFAVAALIALVGASNASAQQTLNQGAARGTQTTEAYAVFAPLIGDWDTGPAGSSPAFVQRFSWGPNQGYVVFRTSLLDGAGAERLHFEGPIMWNGVTHRFDYLFAVEPGSMNQEQGEIHVNDGGDIVRDVTLAGADGSSAHFRQTFRDLGQGRFETSLMRETETGWTPTFPGSDRLLMVRRPD